MICYTEDSKLIGEVPGKVLKPMQFLPRKDNLGKIEQNQKIHRKISLAMLKVKIEDTCIHISFFFIRSYKSLIIIHSPSNCEVYDSDDVYSKINFHKGRQTL